MPTFLDTRGRNPISIAVCARCNEKFPRDELSFDPNYPGLLVCKDDRDQLDPYRLPARQTERITFDDPRPDVSVAGLGPAFTMYANRIMGLFQILLPIPWQPGMSIVAGMTVTPLDQDDPNTVLPQRWFVALSNGATGDTPPDWPTMEGVVIGDPSFLTSDESPFYFLLSEEGIPLIAGGDSDGDIVWLCLGIYPN